MKLTAHPSGKPAWSWISAAGLLALLLILAWLQYRWLEEVSRADRDQARDLLQAGVSRFAEDFDRELTRAFLYLQPQAGPRSREGVFAGRMERWRTYAPFPDLVRDVYRVRRGESGELEASRFDPAEGAFLPAPWPAEMEPLRRRLAAERRGPRRFRGDPPAPGFSLLADDVPALILPMFGPPAAGEPGPRDARPPDSGRPGRRRPEWRRGGPPPPGPAGHVVLRLDLEAIRDVILPRLSEQHLQVGDGRSYDVLVVAQRDGSVVYPREAAADGGGPDGDASAGLFGLLPPEKLGTLELEAGLPEPGGESGDRGRRLREGLLYQRLYRFLSSEEEPRWRVVASHPAGSLDAAVARAHRRNLAIGFGILLLLGTSLMVMLLSTRRLQALARQQLEFVAGVTHELLTPLAAMRSAGQNLADGVVAEPARVRRYGRLVEDEGRRLSNMVEQVLEFAGMQAGRRSYALQRTAPAPIVEAALAEYEPVLDEQGMRVETRLDDHLPEVMADPAALKRAVQNLIANAVKYGAQGAWIGLRAAGGDGPRGPEVRIRVEDRGPGIDAADLPRLFEPFYRGRDSSGSAIPGSGLGLSLVQHIVEGHGGRVTVESTVGEGAAFTLHLPAAAGAEGNNDDF